MFHDIFIFLEIIFVLEPFFLTNVVDVIWIKITYSDNQKTLNYEEDYVL